MELSWSRQASGGPGRVFPAPGLDDPPGVIEMEVPVFVETFVAESPVERFDVGIPVPAGLRSGVFLSFAFLGFEGLQPTALIHVPHAMPCGG